MRIKKIILDGFKSYSNKTVITELDPQFNAITGLNGSGKSNIFDGICFLLGLSSLSHMRVASLQELIYKNGTTGISRARVTIVFDNTDKENSPVEYKTNDEITITRQISNGKTKYYFNQQNITVEKIKSFFQSIQININNPHFLIMQGKINEVINNNPKRLLELLQQTVGISYYKQRKEEVDELLQKKNAKLSEINNTIVSTVEPKFLKFKDDRENVAAYNRNKQEIEELEKQISTFRYIKLTMQMNQQNTELISATNDYDEYTTRFTKNEEDMRAQLEIVESRKSEIDDETSRKYITDLESKIKESCTVLDEVATKTKKCINSRDQLTENVTKHNSILQQSNANIQQYKEQIEKLHMLVQQIEREIELKNDELLLKEDKFKSLKNGANNELIEQQEMQKAKEKLTQDIQQGKAELKKIKETIARTEKEKSAYIASQDNARKNSDENKYKLAKLQEEVIKIKSQISIVKEKISTENDVAEQEKTVKANIMNIEEHIKQLHMESLEAKINDPNNVINKSRIYGRLATLFSIKDKKYIRAIEAILGGKSFNIVTEDEETAKQIISNKCFNQRVYVIPNNKIQYHVPPPELITHVTNLTHGKAVLALKVVDFDSKLENTLRHAFGAIFICDNMETASIIAFDENIKYKAVTIDGDEVDPRGIMKGGFNSAGGHIFQNIEEYKQCKQKQKQEENKYQSIRLKLISLEENKSQYESIKRVLELKEHELSLINQVNPEDENNAQHTLLTYNDKINAETVRSKLKEEKLAKDEAELHTLMEQLSNDKNKSNVSFLEQQFIKCKQEKAELESQLESNKGKVIETEILMHSQEEKIVEASKKAEEIKYKIQSYDSEINEHQQQHSSMEQQISTLKEELQKVNNSMTKNSNTLLEAREKLEQIIKERNENSKEKQKKLELKEKLTEKVQKLQEKVKEIENACEKISSLAEKTVYDEQTLNELETRQENLRIKNNSLAKQIPAMKAMLIDETENEYHELIKKRDKVNADITTIKGSISETATKVANTMENAYQKVNKKFGDIFGTLLPNATAKIEKIFKNEELDGLEFKICFNGKWKESLSELSGGQRSLLALSFILALLQIKPAPFYILDEIDAALDQSHTINIGSLIRTQFASSQFLIISLKDGMFNNASVIYRVSFIDGASTIIRQQLRAKPLEKKETKVNDKKLKKELEMLENK